ncbi:D-aminoacyl-tRNA deacylase [Dehalococcoidia bacterium]|nr:D-aminoacyl-tRNA deacylase [Dehalococcoidia bacterium]
MRALTQRVTEASVLVDGAELGAIGAGVVIFLGVGHGDTEEDAAYLAEKIISLRIFADADQRFNLSIMDIAGEVLLVSQFTLYADTRRGRRPSFIDAAPPQEALPLFECFANLLRGHNLNVETGRFQEHMMVQLVNDGPVTIAMDSSDRKRPRKG